MEFYWQLAMQLGITLFFGMIGCIIGTYIRYWVDRRRGKL